MQFCCTKLKGRLTVRILRRQIYINGGNIINNLMSGEFVMRKTKLKLLLVCFAVSLFGVLPASAVTVLWQGAGVDIYLGRPYNTLEFEDPYAVGKFVQGYQVLDWRDADYAYLPPAWYDEWTVSHSGAIDGHVNEIWMRKSGHSISTNTQVASSVVSIHLNGDNNDGKAEIMVDGVTKAILDMGTRIGSQTALVIVKYLSPTTHNITVNDSGVGPSGLGDDVAVMGAAALGWRKWFPSYWFLDCRLQLIPTPTDIDLDTGGIIQPWVTIPNGWWGGWYWWHHQCCWLRPWLGPIWWSRSYYPWPGWRYKMDWPYWPYYKYYRPWWHQWRWWGGQWFWGFKKCLHYRWRPWPYYQHYYRPRIIYWWSYYWDPEGVGHCVEMVTQSNEAAEGGGGRIMPVAQDIIDGLEVDSHEFSVNGGKVEGEFTPLEWIKVGPQGDSLRNWFLALPGSTPEDTNDFMKTEIVQNLISNSEDDLAAMVGLQYAEWDHPQPSVTATAESLTVTEGGELYAYEVGLADPAMLTGPVTMMVVPSSDQIDVGAGPGEAMELMFDPAMTDSQHVMVMAVDDVEREGKEEVSIAHFLYDPADPTGGGGGGSGGGIVVSVTVQDDECGGMGISEADLNADCKVDLLDFAEVANEWLQCTDPGQP